MSEITVNDVDAYTHGRLAADDDATARALASAYDACRTYCGWHVSPVLAETITLDGPASRLLVLPTLQLQELTSITEDDVELDVATLMWSTRGLVRKRVTAACWTQPCGYWSSNYRALVVTLTHGFDSAPFFDSAVLSYVDRSTQASEREVVGPFQFAATPAANGSAFTSEELAVLDKYKLEWMP